MRVSICPTAFFASLLVVGSAVAGPGIAVSGTAMAVTGDIVVDDYGIVFANGTEMEFANSVADTLVVGGDEVSASVYPVKVPDDPELENGNRLCGAGEVTYVAHWGDPDLGETGFVVAVFTGESPPTGDADMCASYGYQ